MNRRTFLPTLKIPSINRLSLNKALYPVLKRIKKGGTLLEIGPSPDAPYKDCIPHTSYFSLDVDPEFNPDICVDIHDGGNAVGYFDTIFATEVLEHLYNPQQAINEIHRILNPGGVCVLSTRFIHYYHPGPKDYYRFTKDSLEHLFANFSKVEIYPHGNKIQCLWHILSEGKAKVVLNIFNPLIAKIQTKKTKFPLGFIVYAKK